MGIRGLFLGLLAALLCGGAAGEPTLVLSSAQEQPRINLAQHLRTVRLPAQARRRA